MKVSIPRPVGGQLELNLSNGERLFIVGANGSGKSALVQHLVSSNPNEKIVRVSAHRQTWLQSQNLTITGQQRRQLYQNISSTDRQHDSRWTDIYAQERQSAVLFDLVAKENERARRIARQFDNQNSEEAVTISSKEPSPFAQINELLRIGTFDVSLELGKDEQILAQHQNAASPYSVAKMSDGERNAVMIAATVLTVEPETTLLIDEPERHLHRSIIEPFLSALFHYRKDCSFVISTHDLSLPTANPEIRTLVVYSCSWSGDSVEHWDAQVLEANIELPEDLKRAISGSRKRILFVEGDSSGSLDLPLYNTLFPEISIMPKGGCADVLRAVKGLRGTENLHHVEAFGLIDKDNRPMNEINRLANEQVYALNVYSAEALYYCSDAISAVAQHQAETLLGNVDDMIKSAKESAIGVLKESGLAERMAAKRCERYVRNSMMSETPDWSSIVTNQTDMITASISSPYPDELKHFQTLLTEENLDELVARYPLRESRTFDAVARALHLTGRETYEKTLLSKLQTCEELAEKLRNRIKPLADVLTIKG